MDSYSFKINGEIAYESYYDDGVFTPKDLDNHLIQANGRDLHIDIDSVGGCAYSGINIYVKIRKYAEEHSATITTRADGFVASIATVIFLSGDTRIVNEFFQPFIHEPFFGYSEATNADEFKKEYQNLDQVRDLIAEFYSKTTLMTKDQALDIMKNDTWLSSDECLRLGFATEIEILSKENAKIAASMKTKLIKNENKMSKTKLSFYERLTNALTPAKAEMTLAGVDDTTLVFPELEPGDTPEVGDKIVVDDNTDFTGEAESDNYLFSVESGEVSAVVDKTEIDLEEAVEALMQKNETLQAKIDSLTKERDKYSKLYNSIGEGKKPETGKKKIEDKEQENPSLEKARQAVNQLKNKK